MRDEGKPVFLHPSAFRLHPLASRRGGEGRFDLASPAPRAGGQAFLSPALFSSDDRCRAFAAAGRREPVELGRAGRSTLAIRVAAAGTTCFAPASLDGPFGSYRSSCESAAGGLVLRRELEISRARIEPGEYGEARGFWLGVLRADRAAATVEVAR